MGASRILIVRLPCRKVFPIGPIYLLSAVRRASAAVAVHLLDLALVPENSHAGALAETINRFGPDVIAFSWRDIQIFSPQDVDGGLRDAFVFYHDPSFVRKAAAAFRGLRDIALYRSAISRNLALVRGTADRHPSIAIALGGPSVRLFGDHIRARLPARVRVYSETSLDGFFDFLDLPHPGDPLEPGIELEALESAFPQWPAYRGETVGIQTKQGCPHHCLFCLYGFLEGTSVRHRTPANVVREIEGYVRRWGVRRIWFADAQLLSVPSDKEHLARILQAMVEIGTGIEWSGYFRIHEVDEALARLMVRSGLRDLEVSLNSGSQRVVDELCLGFKVEDVVRGLERIASAGYAGKVLVNLSLNAPGETRETLQETIRVVSRMREIFRDDRVVPVIFFLAIQPHTGLERAALEGSLLREGYDPLSVLPWNVMKLIYNPRPLGPLIGRTCALVFRNAEGSGEAGNLVLDELASRITADRPRSGHAARERE